LILNLCYYCFRRPLSPSLFPYTTLFRSQLGHYDKCVTSMREKYKDDGMGTVVAKIFSHLSVGQKNQLIIKLIDHLCGREPGITEDRKSTRLNSSHVSLSYAVFCLKKNRY